jgi:hypothetical protein
MILAVHERIVRDALGDTLGPRGLQLVIRANRRSDLHQLAPAYHFDSAANPRMLCDLWQRGLGAWLARTIVLSAPRDRDAQCLRDHRRALVAFGRATHALADFYAHTNWIELALERGEPPSLAPVLGDACDPERLPPGLQSGYFHLRHGLRGCPRTGPPHGYAYCHAQLNKDSPTRGHGAERPAPGSSTYHEIAVQLAVGSTRAAWDAVGARVHTAYKNTDLATRILTRLARG